jgi:hypothetical protein
LTILRPVVFYQEYVFSLVATVVMVVFLSYETVMTWKRGNL